MKKLCIDGRKVHRFCELTRKRIWGTDPLRAYESQVSEVAAALMSEVAAEYKIHSASHDVKPFSFAIDGPSAGTVVKYQENSQDCLEQNDLHNNKKSCEPRPSLLKRL
jgi:hypothetical protein